MSPLVSNPRLLLNNQGRHTQQLKTRGDLETALSSTYNEHLGLAIRELHLALALLEPLAVVGIGVASPARSGRVVLQTLEVREDVVSLPTGFGGDETENARSVADRVVESEVDANPREVVVRLLVDRKGGLKVLELRAGKLVLEELANAVGSLEGAEIPGHGEEVAPPAVILEHREDAIDVIGSDVFLERVQKLASDLVSVDLRLLGRRHAKAVESGELSMLVPQRGHDGCGGGNI